MNNFIFAFNTVFPLCFLILLGYIVKQIMKINDKTIKEMNRICFYVFLSTSLFMNVYQASFKGLPWMLIIFAIVIVLLSFFILWGIVRFSSLKDAQKGVMVQGIFRSNYILFGLPLTISFFGSNHTSTTAILIAFIIPLYNLLSIIILQFYKSEKIQVSRMLKDTIHNPLIVAALLAFVCRGLSIQFPVALTSSLQLVASSATPLALFLLGTTFAFSKIDKNKRLLVIAVLSKLVILPSIVLGISYCLGFKGEELLAIFAMVASPTAVSSYTMAQQMDMDEDLAGQIVVFTTICSIFTLFVWIFILKACL